MSDHTVIDNAENKRFELTVDGQIAYLEYMQAGDNLVLSHTEVPEGLEGRGIGSSLVKHVLEKLKAEDRKAIITCPFAISYIKRHREYLSVVFGYPST